MGMDVHGLDPAAGKGPTIDWNKKPSKEELNTYFKHREKPGVYFRNNVWWWRPLWEYVTSLCHEDMTQEDMIAGTYNDGHKYNSELAMKMAKKLYTELRAGRTMEHQIMYDTKISLLPNKECAWCKGTGMRNDELGKAKREKNPEFTCNSCEGKGTVKPFEANYPFSAENVREFAWFCKNSGGFQIY